MTLVIAHRGASAYELENTLAAFERARTLGADGVELDVRTTADGVPVVHHDGVAGPHLIRRKPLTVLRDYRLPNGEPVPTLAEALDVLGTDLQVFVEVKELRPRDDAHLLATLEHGPAPAHYQVHAFDHRIVRRLKAQRPTLACGVLSTSYPIRPLAPLEDAGASILWQEEALVDQELIDDAHASAVRVFAWTVDDRERMRILHSQGVDGLCTNRPDVAREVIP